MVIKKKGCIIKKKITWIFVTEIPSTTKVTFNSPRVTSSFTTGSFLAYFGDLGFVSVNLCFTRLTKTNKFYEYGTKIQTWTAYWCNCIVLRVFFLIYKQQTAYIRDKYKNIFTSKACTFLTIYKIHRCRCKVYYVAAKCLPPRICSTVCRHKRQKRNTHKIWFQFVTSYCVFLSDT